MSLSAADGLPLEVMGFIELSNTSGDMSRRVDALVVPSLGPDYDTSLDNYLTSRFGAVRTKLDNSVNGARERQPQILKRISPIQGMEHHHPLSGENRGFSVYKEAFLTREGF